MCNDKTMRPAKSKIKRFKKERDQERRPAIQYAPNQRAIVAGAYQDTVRPQEATKR